MSTINDAPLVELTDVFDKDDYVGPPPAAIRVSSSPTPSIPTQVTSARLQPATRHPQTAHTSRLIGPRPMSQQSARRAPNVSLLPSRRMTLQRRAPGPSSQNVIPHSQLPQPQINSNQPQVAHASSRPPRLYNPQDSIPSASSNNSLLPNVGIPSNVMYPPHYASSAFNAPLHQAPTSKAPTPQAPVFQPAEYQGTYFAFLQHIQTALPGVDIRDMINSSINLPFGAPNLNGFTPEQLQQAISNTMLEVMNRLRTAPAIDDKQKTARISYLEQLSRIYSSVGANHYQGPPKRANVPPPSEDDMAKQDKDADINQDEEYHEVETYADYAPAKLTIGRPHPDPIVETSSLSTVEPPNVYYKLKLPAKVIDNGLLSALQLESVIYACQQHELLLADQKTRRGFLIGDGAGVGKGRTIAGIIYENFLCGRKKSIWLSVSTDLKLDAERDLKDIGANIDVSLLGKFTYGRRINFDSGVIFSTYSGLVSRSQSVKGSLGNRLGQLVAWAGSDFDGVIVFDECHKAKNISLDKAKKAQSKTAEYALEIQNRLPKARVVYASATGASETKHLGYMVRLGIWGQGTPYHTFQSFCSSIERRGVGAMELVAVDLKMRGSYIARQLSFKTTSFEIQIATLDQSFIELYDQCVDLWALALRSFTKASNLLSDRKRLRSIWNCFWAAHQKFFKYLCIGAKVPLVVQIAKAALANDKCVVIGLQSTGEAKTLEALEDGDINEFVSTARATFESLVENHFPAPFTPRRSRLVVSHNHLSGPESSKTLLKSDTSCPSTAGSSCSSVDEAWINNNPVRYSISNGFVQATIDEEEAAAALKTSKQDKKPIARRFAKHQQVLDELAKEKKKSEKVSGRALRAKRRASARGDNKSRIRKLDDDSDVEDSSGGLPISSSDPELGDDDSDTTYRGSEDSSEDDEDDEDDQADENNSTVLGSDRSSVSEVAHTGAADKKKKVLCSESDTDSDIVITAVKPASRPIMRHAVIDILSDDESDEEEDADNPITKHRKELIRMKDEMLDKLDALAPKLPNNTLDDLIDQLGGPSKVAEMTGRKGRIVKDEDGKVSYKNRNEEDALDNLNVAEKERFMKGKKLVAIISEAASSGISLQADRRVKNTKRRVHITIELPWSADRAIQQFGRTHRSNQLSGPEYVFIISELAGEKRFASVVAKRLECLGALTHGDRRATTDSRDLSQFNIASRYCKQALIALVQVIEEGLNFADIRPNYPDGNFIQDSRDAFVGVGLASYSLGHHMFKLDANALQINQFLNRLLGMKVKIQNALFKLFTDIMDRLITRKKVAGLYDAGILELNSDSGKTRCDPPEDFYLKTKAGVVKCTLRNVQVERGISWEEALKIYEEAKTDSRSGFYVSTNPLTKAKMVMLIARIPEDIDLFRVYKPNTGRAPKPDYYSFLSEKSEKSSEQIAERIWRKVFDETHTNCVHICFFKSCKRIEAKMKCDVGLRHRNYCILSGGILTAWPYLESKEPEVTKKLQIVRLKLDANNRVIGPIIPQDSVDRVRALLRSGEQNIVF